MQALAQAEDPADHQLKAVATRLTDIASTVAQEAEHAAATIREMTAHAHDIAQLAADLEGAANLMEDGIQAQARTLAAVRASIAEDEPAIQALAQSIDSVASMSGLIASVAKQSQLLSLNARIEAARVRSGGGGFTVVAQEMSALSTKTRSATEEIGLRARAVAEDIDAARRIALSGADLVTTQETFLDAALQSAGQQRAAAVTMARITAETAARIDDAATGIGRVGSSAVSVKLLARQIARIAGG